MTPEEYRAAIKSLGLTQQRAATLLGVSPRTSHGFAINGPTPPVALALRLLLALAPEDRAPWLAPPQPDA